MIWIILLLLAIVLFVILTVSAGSKRSKNVIKQTQKTSKSHVTQVQTVIIGESTADEERKPLLNGREADGEGKGRVERGRVRDDLYLVERHDDFTSDSAKEATDGLSPEIAVSRKQVTLIVVLLGVAFALAVGFAFCLISYFPKCAFEQLRQQEGIAKTKGIDEVLERDLKDIEKNYSFSIIFDEDKRQEFEERYSDLRKAVERWQEIKETMEVEYGSLYTGRGGSSETTSLKDPERPKSPSYAPTENMGSNDNPGPGVYIDPEEGPQRSDYYELESSGSILYTRFGIEVCFVPYKAKSTAYNNVFIIRDDADETDLQPTDFPVYEEYVRYMRALGRYNVISHDEFMELFMKRYGLITEYEEYRKEIDEIEETNTTQQVAEVHIDDNSENGYGWGGVDDPTPISPIGP